MTRIKPWGEVSWLLSRLPHSQRNSYLIGAVASEERCCAVPMLAAQMGVERIRLVKVDDPPSRFTGTIEEKIGVHTARMREVDSRAAMEIVERALFVDDDGIANCLLDDQFVPDEREVDLWLDISSLPKRFFFLLIKLALAEERIKNLIVTYTQPAPGRYTEEHLSEDPSDVIPLPGFGPMADDPDKLIAAIGFEPLGLPQLLGEYKDKERDLTLIIPFPPGQPYSRRIWETVRGVGHPGESRIRRIPALDAFGAYAELVADSDDLVARVRPPALAPYGPKPISIGMCLYGIDFGCPIYYTQPRVYHPDYTSGVGKTWAYCLKLEGRETWRLG